MSLIRSWLTTSMLRKLYKMIDAITVFMQKHMVCHWNQRGD